ncbi:MAG: prepilin-type N-terminal cleavage/methylation domain-containing protein [Phycisphaerales bacterium]|nr:MAG: prepilin-type N-terminal cleavage/methylation domain-containing protein [Phycisphaerales bacterium]
MQAMRSNRCLGLRTSSGRAAPHAFTLVELLTVVFIIGLLIAILVPSINLARNAAKGAKTASLVKALDTGLEMFKQENERDFRATNGYPPSFAHPLIKGDSSFTKAESYQGRYPFSTDKPAVFGAHWLPFFLMGKDLQGYIKSSSVRPALRDQPEEWYLPEPSDGKGAITDRAPLYVDSDTIRLKTVDQLPGRWVLDPLGGDPGMRSLPTIVDPFDQVVLYYASNTHGRPTNMVSQGRLLNEDYSSQGGPPYYFHQDNDYFTGDGNLSAGWDYSQKARQVDGKWDLHRIDDPGEDLDATTFLDPTEEDQKTFAWYILDRNALRAAPATATSNYPLKPVRPDSYLLITAGTDGRYGTNDDVTNLPKFEE